MKVALAQLNSTRDIEDNLATCRRLASQAAEEGQFGHHFGKRWSYGHSCVYDPWGHLVACASDRVGLTYAEIDLDLVDDIRTRMLCLDHRRL